MSSLTKIKKRYYLRWYDGKKTCPACNGKKTIKDKPCKRCRGTGEVYQDHWKPVSPDRQTALEYKAEFDRKFFRKELGLQDTKKTWASFVEEYLAYSKTNKRPRTYYLDKEALKTFAEIIKPSLLKDITSLHIERWKEERLKVVNPTTLKFDLCQLKAAFSKAVEWSYLEKNPAKNVKQIKMPQKAPRFLSKVEIKKILSIADEQMKIIIQTFLYTGFRIGELINFRWQDIDFKRHEILIQAHDDFQPKDYELRGMPLHDSLFRELYPIKKPEGYVFTNYDGKRLDPSKLNKKFRRLLKTANIEHCTIHGLRHTFASHLVMSGVDLRTVKEVLGHSSITTTMIYSHLSKSHVKKAIDKLSYNL